jgi:hypothetical protein
MDLLLRTQSTLSDLLLFEMGPSPGAVDGDVEDVSNYVAAMRHGTGTDARGVPAESTFDP